MRKLLVTLPLTFGLLLPAYVFARQDHDRDDHDKDRGRTPYAYYDDKHRDWHQWNDSEDKEWRGYLESQHRQYVPFNQADERDQQRYWSYRHKHENH